MDLVRWMIVTVYIFPLLWGLPWARPYSPVIWIDFPCNIYWLVVQKYLDFDIHLRSKDSSYKTNLCDSVSRVFPSEFYNFFVLNPLYDYSSFSGWSKMRYNKKWETVDIWWVIHLDIYAYIYPVLFCFGGNILLQ